MECEDNVHFLADTDGTFTLDVVKEALQKANKNKPDTKRQMTIRSVEKGEDGFVQKNFSKEKAAEQAG